MAATVLINNLVANATTLFEQTGAVSTIAKHTGVDLAVLYASFVTFMHDTGVAQRALYNTIDYSSLNFVEQLWFRWYSSWSNPIIATGVMAFVMHEVSRLTVSLIALQQHFRALYGDRVLLLLCRRVSRTDVFCPSGASPRCRCRSSTLAVAYHG